METKIAYVRYALSFVNSFLDSLYVVTSNHKVMAAETNSDVVLCTVFEHSYLGHPNARYKTVSEARACTLGPW